MNTPHPNLATEARLTWLRQQLDERGSFTIADAAVALEVSEMTIRRDITELEERGLARRVRGGAMPLGPQTFAERTGLRTRAKTQIAAKLITLMPTSGTIALDASSTIMRLAGQIEGARDLTVITNGPDTFTALQGRPGVTPVLTGGQLDPRTGSLVGPLAAWTARQLAADLFMCSASALHPAAGASEVAASEADVKRAIAEGAKQIVLAVDSSKLDHRATAVSIELARIDVLVTELDPADRRLDPFRDRLQLL